MIKQMAMECISILMGPGTKDHGKTICSMGMAKKRGLMAQYMKESIWQEKNMDKVFTAGMMDLGMEENGLKTK